MFWDWILGQQKPKKQHIVLATKEEMTMHKKDDARLKAIEKRLGIKPKEEKTISWSYFTSLGNIGSSLEEDS